MSTEKLIEKTERPHHPWSPSQLQNMEACPCYQGRTGGSVAATKGTKQHNVVETGQDDNTLADDHAIAAAECLDFYARQKQLFEEAREREIAAIKARIGVPDLNVNNLPNVQEFDEIYLSVDDTTYIAPVFNHETGGFDKQTVVSTTGGYIDKGLLSHNERYAELFDWKFGLWPVEDADNNLQAISYVLGFFRKFPKCDEIKFWFKQPHIDVINSHTFRRDDVPALQLRVSVVVARKIEANTRGDFSLARPMIPVCNFCARLGCCDRVAEFACKVAHKFHSMEIPESINPSLIQDPANTAIGLRLAGVLEVWTKAFKSQVNRRVLSGDSTIPDGFTLQKRRDREVVDKAKFLDVARRYLTKDELDSIAEYGFGNIEGTISDKAPRGSKTAMIESFGKDLIDSGAVAFGNEYAFLRAAAKRKTDSTESGS